MSILYPLGLLGLIGVVILIIIYIIKPKYQEKKVSSTYIWKLSLKYYKRKIPLQWLTKSLLFLIQVLAILLTTFLLTRPYIKVDAKSNEKIIIIENSASMQQTLNQTTRLEVAIKEAQKIANNASEDERVSLIICEQDAKYLAYRESTSTYLEHMLQSITPSYVEADISKAIELASEVLDENYKAEVILFSDNKYESYGYVTFRDMSRNEWNGSIIDFTYEFVAGYYQFNAKIASFYKDCSLNVVLSIDGTQEFSKTIEFTNNEVVNLNFADLGITTFTYADLILKDSNNVEIEDAFQYDDVFSLYGVTKSNFKVQFIGENSIFTNAALHSLKEKKCSVYIPTTAEDIKTSGYDLYIFNNVEPTFIPEDGHIWIINPKANTRIDKLDLTIGDTIPNEEKIVIQQPDSPLVKNLLMGLVSLKQYQQIEANDSYEVVMDINSNPILLTRYLNKQRIDVLNIDTHYSNIEMTINMPLLIHNLIDETLHFTSNQSLYQVGDIAQLNFKISCVEAYINNKLVYSQTKPDSSMNYQFDRPGNYVINQKINGNDTKDFVYVRVSESELDASLNHGILAIDEYISPGINYDSNDVLDRKEIYLFLSLGLLVLFVVEWVVQYREQY